MYINERDAAATSNRIFGFREKLVECPQLVVPVAEFVEVDVRSDRDVALESVEHELG